MRADGTFCCVNANNQSRNPLEKSNIQIVVTMQYAISSFLDFRILQSFPNPVFELYLGLVFKLSGQYGGCFGRNLATRGLIR